jgi:hypothetical protein
MGQPLTAMVYSDADRTGLSATTFLILCIWLGPRLACSWLTVVAAVALWAAACRRWPILVSLSASFLRGLLGRRPAKRSRHDRAFLAHTTELLERQHRIDKRAKRGRFFPAHQTRSVAWALAGEPKRYFHLVGLAARAAA